MKTLIGFILVMFATLVFSGSSSAQLDEICGATGTGSSWLSSEAVYGKVGLHGFSASGRFPKITIIVTDRAQREHSYSIDRTGKYCFRDVNGGGGSIVIQLEGNEVVRRSIPASTTHLRQHREDFDVFAPGYDQAKGPGTISAKFSYPRNEKNTSLFEKAAEADKSKDTGSAIKLLREITTSDAKDFVVWARLGSIYFEQNHLEQAESAYKKSLDVKPDFSYAMMNLGRIYLAQQKVDTAIEFLQKATQAEPNAPRGFQLLGEAYLLARKGTLGVEALYEAIRLDPIGMAECHLLIARLYDRANAKPYASREYRLFLEKVPNHADKKKFESYIKSNPEDSEN